MDAGVLVRKELAGAAVTALHTVQNQYRTGFVAGSPGSLQEVFGGHLNPAYALNALHNYRADFFGQSGFKGVGVIERQKLHMFVVVNRCHDGRVVRNGYSSRGASVESFGKGNYLPAAIMEGSQLQGIFVGFRPGIAQEQRVVPVPGNFAQFLRRVLPASKSGRSWSKSRSFATGR